MIIKKRKFNLYPNRMNVRVRLKAKAIPQSYVSG